IAQERSEFLVALGDIVYPTGRVNQYMAYYWSTYNDVEEPGPKTGAPLMASVPFYPVLGNHDISAKLPGVPDALAAFYFFHAPQTGLGEGAWPTPLGNDKVVAARFRSLTADSYPALDAYSFDNGPVHILVLNDNKSVNVEDAAFRRWVEKD